MKNKTYYIGIDPGTHTGIAIYNKPTRLLEFVGSFTIVDAFDFIKYCIDKFGIDEIHIRIEDARKRKWFGKSGREKLQGAGSIKRDCTIWEDFLKKNGLDFELVAPARNRTKLTQKQFEQYTKYSDKTNEHGRDAGMLVYGF